jgi:hypothetical protein
MPLPPPLIISDIASPPHFSWPRHFLLSTAISFAISIALADASPFFDAFRQLYQSLR